MLLLNFQTWIRDLIGRLFTLVTTTLSRDWLSHWVILEFWFLKSSNQTNSLMGSQLTLQITTSRRIFSQRLNVIIYRGVAIDWSEIPSCVTKNNPFSALSNLLCSNSSTTKVSSLRRPGAKYSLNTAAQKESSSFQSFSNDQLTNLNYHRSHWHKSI